MLHDNKRTQEQGQGGGSNKSVVKINYGTNLHACTNEKDKSMAKLIETLQKEFNSVYLCQNEQNSVLAMQKMLTDKL